MTYFAEGLATKGFRVVRFEFSYMALRRRDGRKRPPDRQPVLLDCWRTVIDALSDRPLVIGGKSMGGRMASLIAAEPLPDHVRGLVCLGYPFYGAGRKDKPRVAHLAALAAPTLVCQGTRDAMGDRAAVQALSLSPKIALHWAEDGDHDLKPRKASGRNVDQNHSEALDALVQFLARLA